MLITMITVRSNRLEQAMIHLSKVPKFITKNKGF